MFGCEKLMVVSSVTVIMPKMFFLYPDNFIFWSFFEISVIFSWSLACLYSCIPFYNCPNFPFLATRLEWRLLTSLTSLTVATSIPEIFSAIRPSFYIIRPSSVCIWLFFPACNGARSESILLICICAVCNCFSRKYFVLRKISCRYMNSCAFWFPNFHVKKEGDGDPCLIGCWSMPFSHQGIRP